MFTNREFINIILTVSSLQILRETSLRYSKYNIVDGLLSRNIDTSKINGKIIHVTSLVIFLNFLR